MLHYMTSHGSMVLGHTQFEDLRSQCTGVMVPYLEECSILTHVQRVQERGQVGNAVNDCQDLWRINYPLLQVYSVKCDHRGVEDQRLI